jgi:hypothetical protein
LDGGDQYVRISVGPLKMETKIISQTLHPEWNQDFVIALIGEDKIQGGVCELSVWGAVSWIYFCVLYACALCCIHASYELFFDMFRLCSG